MPWTNHATTASDCAKTMLMTGNEPVNEQYERALLVQIADEDERGFTKFMQIYQAKLRGFTHSYADQLNEDPDDLTQEIFLQIYLSAKRFKGQSTVRTWVFSIARNIISNQIRKKKLLYFWKPTQSRSEFNSGVQFMQERSSNDGEYYLQTAQDHQLIHSSLMKVSKTNREVLALFEFSGLSYEEIASLIGVNIGTVKSRLFNARKELAKLVLACSKAE